MMCGNVVETHRKTYIMIGSGRGIDPKTLNGVKKGTSYQLVFGFFNQILVFTEPTYLVKMVSSFLDNRQSFVSLNNFNSTRISIPAGVPQGSPLSPFLFNIFINDLSVPQNCKIVIYVGE